MSKRIDIPDDDIDVFKAATKTQYESDLYKQLKKNKQLDRFISALQLCALRGMKLTETCRQLSNLFPSFVRGSGLNPGTLSSMIAFYPDLEEAWGFSSDIVQMLIYNKAKKLVEMSDYIGDIEKFNKMYDSGDLLYIREQAESNSKSSDNDDTDIIGKVDISNSRLGGEQAD